MKNVKLSSFFELFKHIEEYQKMYDPYNYQKDWKVITPFSMEKDTLSMCFYNRTSLGAMCSDREMVYQLYLTRISETESEMLLFSVDHPDVILD